MRWNVGFVLFIPAVMMISAFPAGQRLEPLYVESSSQSELDFRFHNSPTSRKYLIETMAGGVAIFDFDADGWPDVFFVNGAALKDPQPDNEPLDKAMPEFWNRLFRNNRDGTFSDVTLQAGLQGSGYGMGAATGDYDNDGFTDLVVTTYGGAVLYHNEGNGTFSDVTAIAHIKTSGWTTGAGFFDYDLDGCLDLVVASYLEWDFAKGAIFCGTNVPGGRSYCHPDEFLPTSSYLFRSNCDGTFTDVSGESGLAAVKGKALGLAFADYDDDGLLDIYVANDSAPQMLFHNEGNGRFHEIGTQAGVAYTEDGKTFAGMGTVFADIDNDGLPDIVTTALPYEYYAFFHNSGEGQFEYASISSALSIASRPYSGWGIHLFDFDNDGRKELFVANGHVMDNIELTQPHLRSAEPPLLLKYIGGKFADISRNAGEMFTAAWAARGAAFGDLDNDGDIDIVVTDYRAAAHFLRNEGGSRNHWIGLDLRGTKTNRDAIGTKIRLTDGSGERQYATVSTAGSYLSANDRRVFFGLGQQTTVREIQIRWPSGAEQIVSAPQPDRIVNIVEESSQAPGRSPETAQRELERGLALARQGKNGEAVAAFREAIQRDADLLEAHFSLGVLLARLGRENYGEAFTQFVEVLRLNPGDVDAHINLSNLLETGSNLAASVAEMRRAVELASSNTELHVMLGQKQLRAYQYAEAADTFRQALASGHRNARSRYGLGVALKHLRDLEQAASEFEAALQLNPGDAYSELELGNTLVEQNRAQSAIEHLEAAVRLQPDMADAWFALAKAWRRLERPADTAAALRKGLALKPDDSAALYQLAVVSNDKDESRELLARVQELKAREARLAEASRFHAEGMGLMENNRLAEALEAFRRALASDPGFAVAAYNSGVVLTHQGASDAAMEAFRDAIRIDPGLAAAHRGLGLLLQGAGDPAAAQELRAAELLESLASVGTSTVNPPQSAGLP